MLQGLYTASTGLKASQHALDVTSHNLANADTEGYTKQRVNFTTNPIKDTPNASMDIKMGTGTHIQSVNRIEDTFLYDRLNQAKQDFTRNNEQLKSLELVDELVQQESFTGLYDGFFESIHRYAESPHNVTLEHLAEQSAKDLIDRSNDLQEVFNKTKERNNRISAEIQESLPDIKEQIEYLDLEIKKAEAMNEFTTDKTYANQLRDNKDLLETEYKTKESSVIGLSKSNENLSNIQNMFKESFDSTYTNIQTYLDSGQTGSDANDLIDKEDGIRTDWEQPFISLKSMKTTAETMTGSTEHLMNSLQNKDDNISKVSVDEEMVNMMRYQAAYEANAKVVQTMDEIMQTTLDLKR